MLKAKNYPNMTLVSDITEFMSSTVLESMYLCDVYSMVLVFFYPHHIKCVIMVDTKVF